MRLRRGIALLVVSLLMAGLVWYVAVRRTAPPVAIAPAALSGWTLVTSDGTDPWVVGIRPPDSFVRQLFTAAGAHAGRTLIAPSHAALPLVLRTEYEEGLQGVYGTDSVMRMAGEAGLELARFQPVCLAHRTYEGSAGRGDLYFVPFESAEFTQLRIDITPVEPEHAGIGIYEPGALSPVLVVGATDAEYERLLPLYFDPDADCEGPLTIAAP